MSDSSGSVRWKNRRRSSSVLGVVMIVKNEVKNLPRLLRSVADVADEVVIADTGSTDGTIALCREWGVTLLRVPWRDDFAFARNRSIEGASARYLLRLDADEELPEETRRDLVRLRNTVLPHGAPTAYDFVVINRNTDGTETRHRETRIFPNLPHVRFRGAIHEEIVTDLAAAGIEREKLEAEVLHFGYEDGHVVDEKNRRNESLLRASLQANPGNVHVMVHLALTAAGRGEFGEAESILSEALLLAEERGGVDSVLRAELHLQRAGFRQAATSPAAARHDLRRARALAPEWAVPDAMEAEIAVLEGDWEAAEAAVERARSGQFTCCTLAFPLKRFRSNVELFAGLIAQRDGDAQSAEDYLRRAIGIDQGSVEARVALGQLLVDRGSWADALAVLEPAGENKQAVGRFVDIATLIAVARFGVGDTSGAAACLAPLLDVFAQRLGGRTDVHPLELAEATLRSGYPHAARNMMTLAQLAA